jgi:ribosomal protein S18 acetylase RimI-like enzyme
MSDRLSIIQVESEEQTQSARQLFEEYAAGIGISLCFQNFDQELATLPGKYAPPGGRLLLAYEYEELAGCIALRAVDDSRCEMKRLFVRPAFRGTGLGRVLVEAIIKEARGIGYQSMLLDTLPGRMDSAIALYRKMGFEEIEPYYENPVADAKFMELKLQFH